MADHVLFVAKVKDGNQLTVNVNIPPDAAFQLEDARLFELLAALTQVQLLCARLADQALQCQTTSAEPGEPTH